MWSVGLLDFNTILGARHRRARVLRCVVIGLLVFNTKSVVVIGLLAFNTKSVVVIGLWLSFNTKKRVVVIGLWLVVIGLRLAFNTKWLRVPCSAMVHVDCHEPVSHLRTTNGAPTVIIEYRVIFEVAMSSNRELASPLE